MQCFVEARPGEGVAVGLAVSSRQFNAVRRNRLRRLMREGFAREGPALASVLARNGQRASLVFLFRPVKTDVADRLRLEPVRKDMAAICSRIAARL